MTGCAGPVGESRMPIVMKQLLHSRLVILSLQRRLSTGVAGA